MRIFKRDTTLVDQPSNEILKNIKMKKAIWIVAMFLMINILKITWFDCMLIPTLSIWTILYKFMSSALIMVVIYILIFRLKYRGVFTGIYCLQVIYMIVNISYYSFFHSYLGIMQWYYLLIEGVKVAENAPSLPGLNLLISLIDLPFAVLVIAYYRYINKLNIQMVKIKKLVILSLSIIILCMQVCLYISNSFITQLAKDRYMGEPAIVEWYGVVANNILNAFYAKSTIQLTKDLKYGNSQTGNASNGIKPNFCIIQMESIDSNVIDHKYKDQYIAPYLHSLAQNNCYYPYTLSYHEGGGTSDCEFSVINSVEPFMDYPAMKLSGYNYPNSFIKKLSSEGYFSNAFHGNVGNYFNRTFAFRLMGFQEFYDINKMKLNNQGWGAPDDKVYKFEVSKLRSEKAPFIAYTITMTGHAPFTNARKYYNNPRYDDISYKKAKDFFNSISYVDQSIEKVVNEIQMSFPNTYIFIFGDHSPSVNNSFYKQATFSDGYTYFEFVPLIIVTPDKKQYKESKQVAAFIDIAPTILRSSGIKFEILSDGQNLLNPSERTLQSLKFKGGEFDRAYLYDQVSKIKLLN